MIMMVYAVRYVHIFLLIIGFLSSIQSQSLPDVKFVTGNVVFPNNVNEETTKDEVLVGESFNGYYHRWVQFEHIPSEEMKDQLEEFGAEFVEYVPSNCYLMALPEDVDMSKLHDAGVRSITPLGLQHKLDSRILYDDIPAYAQVGSRIKLKLMTYPNTDSRAMSGELESFDIRDLHFPNHDRFILFSADPVAAGRIAKLPWVRYVELMDPKGEPESIEGRTIQKANLIDNHLTSGGLSYNGEGVKILVRDDGDVGPHIDFQGRLWNDPNNGGGGTHGEGVAGVWAATGNLDPTIVAGGSAADLYVIDYLSTFLDNTLTLHQDSGVVITNSSYSNGCNAGYTSTTVTVDEMAFDNPTLTHVFSAGNSNGSDCGYGAGNQWGNVTGGHKMGKNVVTVANLFRDGSLVNSSSRGPAHDGRIKPDLSGHGQGQISTAPDNGYMSFGGTSAAAPSTAGNLTQLYHVYEDLNGSTPPSALIKACALNTAQDLGNVGPDFKFGWGLIHTGRAYEILANNQYLEATISNGGNNTHNITVPGGVGELRIMLYWPDPEASVSASPALVNDLDLVVEDPSSTNHLPYLLDHTPNPVNLDLPAGNGADHLNNMEQVAISSPAAGVYTVDVDGFAVPEGPQTYYIVYAFIPTGVQLTYPLGGEKLVEGSTERIHWDAFGNTGVFNLEYSTNNGGSWTSITTGVPASQRAVDWTLPSGVISGNCLVRISRGGQTDQSDETFHIHSLPTNLSVADVALDSVMVSWTPVGGATSYNVYQLGDRVMELVGTTAGTSFIVGDIAPGITHWFSVSANTGGAQGRRAIAVSHTHDVGTVCNGCIYSVTLPYTEDFEEGFGFHCNVAVGDDLDWIRQSNGTPSVGTGPTSAFDGQYYIYVEATSPNFPSMSADLGGPCLDLSSYSNAYLEFYYHMFGTNMGSLVLEVSTNQGSTWSTPIWSISGNQGDQWHLAQIDLTPYCGGDLTYRLVGTTGNGFESDIAIDALRIEEGQLCFAPSNLGVVNITEEEAEVNWSAASTAISYDLELVDISAGGSFTGVPTVSGIVGTTELLMGLNEFNEYEVYIQSICSGTSSHWIGPIQFVTDGCLSIASWDEDFDNYTTCSTDGGAQSCDFGGGWTQDGTDGNDWRVNFGATPSVGTGPLADHTTGSSTGQYLYIEASTDFNLTSNLISPCIELDATGAVRLAFYYHMHGGDMGTLNVDVTTNGGGSWTNLWTQSGQVQVNQSDPWLEQEIDLSAYSGEIQLRFQGVAGSSWESDMAIDDIRIFSINCNTTGPITGTPASGEYRTAGVLESDALIQNPNFVLFSGALGVDLQANFEVELGAEFEANVDGCN